MIDFAALVLGPAISIFGRPVTVTPVASQPGSPPYQANAVYALKSVQIQLEETGGTFQQGFQASFGIRLTDFAVPPAQGDTIAAAQGTFVVENVIPDGQGGATLMLRETG